LAYFLFLNSRLQQPGGVEEEGEGELGAEEGNQLRMKIWRIWRR